MKLELGTTQERNGWITVDGQGGTYQKHIPPLPEEIFDYTFERVECYHFWEHLYLWEAEQLAREVYSVLEPGGRFILELPNLRMCCQNMIDEHPDIRMNLWGLYGAQSDPQHYGNPFQAHKWGYTPESLMKQLLDAGFKKAELKEITRGQKERDMRIEAVK